MSLVKNIEAALKKPVKAEMDKAKIKQMIKSELREAEQNMMANIDQFQDGWDVWHARAILGKMFDIERDPYTKKAWSQIKKSSTNFTLKY